MYTYDANAAAEADAGSGAKYISETGAYPGKIIKATGKKTTKGGDSVTLAFQSDSGQQSDYLTLQIQDAQGKKFYGYGTLMAVLRCAAVRTINPTPLAGGKPGEVEFKELAGKACGLVLQRQEYQKQDGSIAERMEIVAAFDAKTRKMATELDNNQPAAMLSKMLESLPALRKLKNPKPAPAGGYSPAGGPAPMPDDFGDDVGF